MIQHSLSLLLHKQWVVLSVIIANLLDNGINFGSFSKSHFLNLLLLSGKGSLDNGIIWLQESLSPWPKVILLSGAYCSNLDPDLWKFKLLLDRDFLVWTLMSRLNWEISMVKIDFLKLSRFSWLSRLTFWQCLDRD